MKKLLTLVLCWLIAFSAMAETTLKAKTALSAAGGYITSLNKVDGSFEDGTAGWVASTDTIVQTASTEFQGNYKGTWTATGTGTLDLQWTATAANTYEATAQVNVQGEDDMYICAYVGATETGCKLIPALNKIQKVSVVADSVISSAFYLRLKHTGSDAFSIDIDDGKIEPWTPQAVNLVQQEYAYYYGNSGTAINADANDIPFTTLEKSTLSYFGSWSGTQYTAKQKQSLYVYAFVKSVSGTGARIYLYLNGSSTNISSPNIASTAQYKLDGTIQLNAGDVLSVRSTAGFTVENQLFHKLILIPSAISDNVVQSWQDGMATWSATSTIQIGATTTAPTKGTTDLDQVKWIKRGESAEFWYQYNQTGAGTTGSGDYLFSLPSGMQFDSSKVTFYTTLEGLGDWVAKNGIPGGVLYQSTFDGSLYVLPYDSTRFRLGFVGGFGTQASLGVIGSSAGPISVATSFSLKFSAPIAGWSSAPTLLALPTSKENVFSAKIAANATITNKNADWINSVSVSDTSLYTIDITKLGLTAAPQVNANITGTWTTANAPRWATVQSVSSSSIVIRTHSLSGGFIQYEALPFEIKIQKQSPDYTAPGVFIGSLAKDYTAYVDASEVITNATDNFITACTNADPTVCTFASTKFGTAPYCNAQKTSSADVYVTTTSTTSVTIERADSSSPFSLFCQIK